MFNLRENQFLLSYNVWKRGLYLTHNYSIEMKSIKSLNNLVIIIEYSSWKHLEPKWLCNCFYELMSILNVQLSEKVPSTFPETHS